MDVFHKRKFPKVKSETQVSFVNEAPGALFKKLTYVFKLSFENFLLGDTHNLGV
jgi:hypothetical protein